MQALTSAHSVLSRPSTVVRQDLAITRQQFESWLRQAAPGDRAVYHRGHLAVDRVRGSGRLSGPARRELVAVANRALALAKQGEIHLVQERTEPGTFRYIAVKAHGDRVLGMSR